ncbi:kinase-like domain-containing protein [Lasiosphaeria hispida]|uniref:Kinase-like domain-containing protein n=1 Tax=Lasiosphaeria hispida TaxID=260671 RepID=A0AAJ0HHB2_9PEZI|nr:kinase-like domain-containing protein [Lasiosphaeria hispida]
MSELTITSKDDVECTVFVDPKDSSVQVGARYVRWVLGSVREDDALYMTKVLDGPPSGHSAEQIQSALGQVPGESIFPPLPIPWWFASTGVTVNDSWDTEPDLDVYYLKRPWLAGYDADHDAATNMPSRLAQWFACEIKRLEQLARHATHPNLVHYHGCRVRNGRITAAILGRVPGDTLMNYAKAGKTIPDKEAFLRDLASAVHHLHNVVGLVHNDIQPTNIMVSPDGTTPTLIDLGSAWPEGEEIIHCPVLSCWGNDPLDMDPETFFNGPLTGSATSRKSRDLAALERLRTWLDNPDFTYHHRLQDADFAEVGNRRMQEAAVRRTGST